MVVKILHYFTVNDYPSQKDFNLHNIKFLKKNLIVVWSLSDHSIGGKKLLNTHLYLEQRFLKNILHSESKRKV